MMSGVCVRVVAADLKGGQAKSTSTGSLFFFADARFSRSFN